MYSGRTIIAFSRFDIYVNRSYYEEVLIGETGSWISNQLRYADSRWWNVTTMKEEICDEKVEIVLFVIEFRFAEKLNLWLCVGSDVGVFDIKFRRI